MKTLRITFCALLIAFIPSLGWTADRVSVEKTEQGWSLMLNGEPYIIKGVIYGPMKVGDSGQDASVRDWKLIDEDGDGRVDTAFQSFVDKNRNNIQDADEPEEGDFHLLKEMGCNTIRAYHHATKDPELRKIHRMGVVSEKRYNHDPERDKSVYRSLYEKYGIRVAMGDLIGAYIVGAGATWDKGTDYTDPVQRKNMLKSVRDMVMEYKDEPYILLWVLGNENNLGHFTNTNAKDHPAAYARFVNEAAQLIHKLDPDHPVALSNGETGLLRYYAKFAPEVDIFGINSYRYPGFGNLWEEVAKVYDKPVMLTEYGTGHPPVRKGHMDEDRQAEMHRVSWRDIIGHSAGRAHPGNAIGGFAFQFIDNWWQQGNPWQHDLADNHWHLEWNGLCSMGNGQNSLFLRQPRKAYFTYQEIWGRN